MLWSQTNIVYIESISAPSTAGLTEQFGVYTPCEKLITRLELEFYKTSSCQLRDLRGVRYFTPLKEVTISPILLDNLDINAAQAIVLNHYKVDNVGADEFLLQEMAHWLLYGNINATAGTSGDLRDHVLRRSRKYHILLRLLRVFGVHNEDTVGVVLL